MIPDLKTALYLLVALLGSVALWALLWLLPWWAWLVLLGVGGVVVWSIRRFRRRQRAANPYR